MRTRSRSKNKFIAIVENDECVGGMGCGNKYNAHLATGDRVSENEEIATDGREK